MSDRFKRTFLELWRGFAANHINNVDMTGAEIEALTIAAFRMGKNSAIEWCHHQRLTCRRFRPRTWSES
jgi:hypothetical protein